MLRVTVLLLMALLPAVAQDAAKMARVEELLEITQADQMMSRVLEQMKTMQTAEIAKALPAGQQSAAAENSRKIMDLLSSRLTWERIKPVMVSAYAETFSDQELDGIIAFYRSPTGRAMVEKMPQPMMRSMAATQFCPRSGPR